MADRTPYFRASYDAVETTPRPPVPPTTTGLPRSDGLSRCSTAAKNASRSRWSTDASDLTAANYPVPRTAPTLDPAPLPSTGRPPAHLSPGPAGDGPGCPPPR